MKKILETLGGGLFWRRLNLGLTYFWILLLIGAIVFGWVKSVTFVSILSLVALILASQSSWQASRIEHKEEIRDPDNPVTG